MWYNCVFKSSCFSQKWANWITKNAGNCKKNNNVVNYLSCLHYIAASPKMSYTDNFYYSRYKAWGFRGGGDIPLHRLRMYEIQTWARRIGTKNISHNFMHFAGRASFFYFFYFCNRRSNIDDTNVETKRIRIQLIIWNHIRIIIYNNNNMLCQSTHKQSDILLYIEILTNNIRNNAIKALYMLYQHDYMI